jgi:hypothetical protein
MIVSPPAAPVTVAVCGVVELKVMLAGLTVAAG